MNVSEIPKTLEKEDDINKNLHMHLMLLREWLTERKKMYLSGGTGLCVVALISHGIVAVCIVF